MAGRGDLLNERQEYVIEPKNHLLDLNKCLFIIISVTPINNEETSRTAIEDIELPNDLIDISDLIEVLTNEPFNIDDEKIKRFINPDDSNKIYYELSNATRKDDIENIIIFYQGFGYIFSNQLLLLLDNIFINNSSKYIKIDEIDNIIKHKTNINVVMFLDCSYSALAFDDFGSENFVIIASCNKDEHAYFKYDKNTKRQTSIFSSALVETIKEAARDNKEYFSLSELYLRSRSKVIESIENLPNNKKIKQLPAISTRNLTQFYRFINTSNYDRSIKENKNISISKEEKVISFSKMKLLIASNKVRDVISILVDAIENFSTEEQNEIINHSHKFQNNERSKRLEIISPGEYHLSLNRIQSSLLEFLDDLKMNYGNIRLK